MPVGCAGDGTTGEGAFLGLGCPSQGEVQGSLSTGLDPLGHCMWKSPLPNGFLVLLAGGQPTDTVTHLALLGTGDDLTLVL